MPGSSTSITPHASDVICGRGKGSFNRPGNRRFLSLVSQSVCRYKAARKSEKTVIASQIIKDIQNSGARFLCKKGGEFVELDQIQKVAKITHAFRDWRKESDDGISCGRGTMGSNSDTTSTKNVDIKISPTADHHAAAPSPSSSSQSKKRAFQERQMTAAPTSTTTNKNDQKQETESKNSGVKSVHPESRTSTVSTSGTTRGKVVRTKEPESLGDLHDPSLDGENTSISKDKPTVGLRTRSCPDDRDHPLSSRKRQKKNVQKTDEKNVQSKPSSSATTEEAERRKQTNVHSNQPTTPTAKKENPPSLTKAGVGASHDDESPSCTILAPHCAQMGSIATLSNTHATDHDCPDGISERGSGSSPTSKTPRTPVFVSSTTAAAVDTPVNSARIANTTIQPDSGGAQQCDGNNDLLSGHNQTVPSASTRSASVYPSYGEAASVSACFNADCQEHDSWRRSCFTGGIATDTSIMDGWDEGVEIASTVVEFPAPMKFDICTVLMERDFNGFPPTNFTTTELEYLEDIFFLEADNNWSFLEDSGCCGSSVMMEDSWNGDSTGS